MLTFCYSLLIFSSSELLIVVTGSSHRIWEYEKWVSQLCERITQTNFVDWISWFILRSDSKQWFLHELYIAAAFMTVSIISQISVYYSHKAYHMILYIYINYIFQKTLALNYCTQLLQTIALNSYGPLLWCVFEKRISRIFLHFTEQTWELVNNDRISYLFGQAIPLNHSLCWLTGLEWNTEITCAEIPTKSPCFFCPLLHWIITCTHANTQHTVKTEPTASGQPTQLAEYLFLLSTS